MRTVQHSESCQQITDKSLATMQEWTAKWPNFCKKCEGAGVHVFFESHGFKYGAREELHDPCSCTEIGMCARCGECGLTEDGDGPCTLCQWNYDDARPQVWECYGRCTDLEMEGESW